MDPQSATRSQVFEKAIGLPLYQYKGWEVYKEEK